MFGHILFSGIDGLRDSFYLLLLRWAPDQYLLGWIVILALGAAERAAESLGFSLLFARLNLTFSRLGSTGEAIRYDFLIVLLWLTVAILVGIAVARKKGFSPCTAKANNE